MSLPGDINGDGRVDLDDFLILARHFGQLGAPDQGDLNGDGTINLADLLILVRNFGRSELPVPGRGAAPLEPQRLAVAAFRRNRT